MSEEIEPTPSAKPKKMRKLLPVILIAAILLIAGAVLGLGRAGIIKIPGLTPAKKAAQAAELYAEKSDPKIPAEPEEEEQIEEPGAVNLPPAEPEIEPDRDAGAKKIAGIWNNMEAADIVAMGAAYEPQDFARVLSKMDPEKVAEVLSAIPDKKRAARISLAIEEIAAEPVPVESF